MTGMWNRRPPSRAMSEAAVRTASASQIGVARGGRRLVGSVESHPLLSISQTRADRIHRPQRDE